MMLMLLLNIKKGTETEKQITNPKFQCRSFGVKLEFGIFYIGISVLGIFIIWKTH